MENPQNDEGAILSEVLDAVTMSFVLSRMKIPWTGFSQTERARFPARIRRGHNRDTLDPNEHRILQEKRACAVPRLRPFLRLAPG